MTGRKRAKRQMGRSADQHAACPTRHRHASFSGACFLPLPTSSSSRPYTTRIRS
ncbi:MAG: hypothetical protein LQ347_006921, partial [Umbilicaria vellea]